MLDDQGWDDLDDRIGDIEKTVDLLRDAWAGDNRPNAERLARVREHLGRVEREVQTTLFWLDLQ